MNTKMICQACLLLVVLAVNVCEAQDWHYVPSVNEFTDKDEGLVTLTDGAIIQKSQTTGGVQWPIPSFVCVPTALTGATVVPTIYVNFGKSFAGNSDNEVIVQIRVDGGEAYRGFWDLHEPGFFGMSDRAWIRARNQDVRRLLREMYEGNELLIGVTDPLDGEQLTARLDLSGFSEALEQLPCFQEFWGI